MAHRGGRKHLIPTTSPRLDASQYAALVERVRAAIESATGPDARVLVASHGDDDLLKVAQRVVKHFPQNEIGAYAGYHPAESVLAINHLEALRSQGATHLVFPQTMFWWLGYYDELREHLLSTCRILTEDPDTCVIFRLDGVQVSGVKRDPDARHTSQLERLVSALVPDTARLALVGARPPSDKNAGGRWSGVAFAGDPRVEIDGLAARGISFLVIDRDAFDWLENNPLLQDHLAQSHRLVTRQRHVCEIYELDG